MCNKVFSVGDEAVQCWRQAVYSGRGPVSCLEMITKGLMCCP